MSVDAEKQSYGLGYSDAETQRLMAQNAFLVKSVGYTIHPSMRPHLPRSPKIADFATGTGGFLVSLSEELPSDSQLDGYDISDSAFIPNEALPNNVKLHILNVKAHPPAELTQQYDAVFIRFMNIAMKPEDWAFVARTALYVLKPGGAIQWFEADFRQLGRPLIGDPSHSTEAFETIGALYNRLAQYDGWCVDNLTRVLNTVGFDCVKRYVSSTDRLPEMRPQGSQLGIVSPSRVIYEAIAKGNVPGLPSKEDLDVLVAKAKEEVANGAYARVDLVVWVAFKPQ